MVHAMNLFPIRQRVINYLLALLFGLVGGWEAQGKGTNQVLFADHFESSLAGRWEPLRFGRLTDYYIACEGSNMCLKAVADRTCSALMSKVELNPTGRLIARWQWKIDHIPTNSTDHIASSFDHTARIIIAFDTFIGPPRTLNYIWANRASINTVLPHLLSGRAQMIALQSGDARAGEWICEERDVTADWHQLFGDKPMPQIIAVGVITDSENTGSKVTGYYRHLELVSE